MKILETFTNGLRDENKKIVIVGGGLVKNWSSFYIDRIEVSSNRMSEKVHRKQLIRHKFIGVKNVARTE